jgi:Fur family ferric uptake transcriptional regulator
VRSNLDLAPRIRSIGLRVTPQRMAILGVLSRSGAHLAPKQVYERARRSLPDLAEPTVYRTLELLCRIGLVWPLHLENGHLAYELAGKNHHHLVCGQCGSEVELQHALFEEAYSRAEGASGYVVNRDHLTLSGLCPRCQRRGLQTAGS